MALDYELRLRAQELPQEGVSFNKIDCDVTNALKFARESKYYIAQPQLKEKVGVFVTDDLVPVSLQSEVCQSTSAGWLPDRHETLVVAIA